MNSTATVQDVKQLHFISLSATIIQTCTSLRVQSDINPVKSCDCV